MHAFSHSSQLPAFIFVFEATLPPIILMPRIVWPLPIVRVSIDPFSGILNLLRHYRHGLGSCLSPAHVCLTLDQKLSPLCHWAGHFCERLLDAVGGSRLAGAPADELRQRPRFGDCAASLARADPRAVG